MRFVDTDVLLYAVSIVPEEAVKAERARALLEASDLALSVQVLQEFYVQATRVTRANRLTHEEAANFVTAMLRFRVQDLTVRVMQSALGIKARYALSYWDSTILAAALAAGCRQLHSEDLAHGGDYDGVRVVNPFL